MCASIKHAFKSFPKNGISEVVVQKISYFTTSSHRQNHAINIIFALLKLVIFFQNIICNFY